MEHKISIVDLGVGDASMLNLLLGFSLVSISWTCNVLPPYICTMPLK